MSKELLQEQLQKALLTTFLANLAFLSEYDNSLYNRLIGLSDSIDRNEYKERYFLEFIEDCGDFDIYDSYKEEYLYKKKSKYFNNLAADSVKLDSSGEFVSFNKMYYNKKFLLNNSLDDVTLENSKDSQKYVLSDLSEFVNALDDELDNIKEKEYKKIEKIIFLGSLLGRHILNIFNKYKPKHFFVCEDNLEIFRLSLFVFDYSLLARNNCTVVFSIMEDASTFNANFKRFFLNNTIYNGAIKYYSTNYNTEHFFDRIFTSIVDADPFSFNYFFTLFKQAKISFDRIGNYDVLTFGKELKDNFFKDKKVLLVGAGPSLDNHIDWIQENQDSFVIVAMGASYKKLIDHGIKIEILITLDGSKIIYEKQFSDKKYIKGLSNTLIIASIMTDQAILDQFNDENIFLYTLDYQFFVDNKCPAGFSVGEVSVLLLLFLKSKELYLVGLDFSFNQISGLSHSEYAHSNKTVVDINKKSSFLETNSYHLKNDNIWVQGYNKEVITNRLLYMSAISLNNSLKSIDKDVSIYTLSKDAAFVNNIQLLEKELFNKSIKNTNHEDIRSYLNNYSRVKLDEFEINLLKNEKNYLKKFLNEFEKLEKLNITSYDFFEKTYFKLINQLCESYTLDSSLINRVFSRYFNSINSYIYYHFNDKNIKNESKKIIKIRKIIHKQLGLYINKYLDFLNVCIKCNEV